MTTNELRQKFVETAKRYVGVREGSSQHKAIVDRYNSQKKLPRGYKLKYNDAWCAGFVSSVAIECGMEDIIPLEVSCAQMIALAKKMGIWQEADNYKAQPGDLILYDWDDSGKGDNTGNPDHVGIVEARQSGSNVIVEGNYQNAVKRRVLAVGGRYIRGYICPNFAAKATTDDDDLDVVAKEVIRGKWGNNPERKQKLTAAGYDYKKVQTRVNEIIDRVAREVIDGKWGNGDDRKKRLNSAGYDYKVIQDRVNKLMK